MKIKDISSGLERPSHDHWIGVNLTVLNYVRALESRIHNIANEQEFLQQFVRLEHKQEIARLQQLLLEKESEISRLHQEIARLQERLNTSSRNSSKPPSSDPPSAPKRVVKKPTGKRRGGQPGHPLHTREHYPTEQCNSVTEHKPHCCRKCGELLNGKDPKPLRHQIIDLPTPQPRIDEHQLHSLRCHKCGAINHANLPEDVNPTGFGPGVTATVATLVTECRASHRMTTTIMKDLCGVRLALGTVSKLLRRVNKAIEQPVKAAREFLCNYQGAKYVDETGWYNRGADGSNEQNKAAWLWVAASQPVTVFHSTLSRAQQAAREIIGSLDNGALVTDRYLIYNYADANSRQLCWAHLIRDFVRFTERKRAAAWIGKDLLKVARRLFKLTARYREGKLSLERWQYFMGRLRMRARRLLEIGAQMETAKNERSPRSKTKHTCEQLLKLEAALWLFVRRPDVEPTNNLAERSLRHAVILRRVSFGSQSEEGAEWIARLLTVMMTLRSRGESFFHYLLAACRAAQDKTIAPSLLPTGYG